MSRTDKTRPYHVKMAELQEADPFGTRREAWVTWRREFGCGRSCKSCYGWASKQEDRKARRQSKTQTRNWKKEYE